MSTFPARRRVHPRVAGALLTLTAALASTASAQSQETSATPAVDSAEATAQIAATQTAPVFTRSSELQLAFEAPVEAQQLILAADLPTGATFVPGSARLDDAALPDPRIGAQGRLYWTLPAVTHGVLSYRVTHAALLEGETQPGLLALYRGGRNEVLMGTVDVPDALSAVAPLVGETQNPGVIKFPLDGAVYRDRDRVTVVVAGALGSDLTLSVGGVPVSDQQIGTLDRDPALQTEKRTYVGVQLQPGSNIFTAGTDTVHVQYAGRTSHVEIVPQQLLADGSTPLRLKVRALDASGVLTAMPFVTLRTSIEPVTPDANPQEAGYQVRLKDGEGEVELRAQTLPVTLSVETLAGDLVEKRVLAVKPNPAHVGLGQVSVTVGVAPLAIQSVHGSGYYEGMIGAGKLYVAADSAGLPTSSSTDVRYPLHGDASTASVQLQGVDPVAFRYEHPGFSVQYRQAAVPIDVFGVGEGLTTLSASTRGETIGSQNQLSAFVAAVPGERVSETLIPDGTRLLHLAHPAVRDSDTVEQMVREQRSGKELSRTTLRPDADYTLDVVSGSLVFAQPALPYDAAGNPVTLEVHYRTGDALGNRQLGFGVQLSRTTVNLRLAAAAVQLGGVTTYGVKAAYKDDALSASTLLAYAGGVQVSADAGVNGGGSSASASLRYQDAGYNGLNAFQSGLHAAAHGKTALGGAYALQADADLNNDANGLGGSASLLGSYNAAPFTVGAGLKAGLGTEAGLSLIGSAAYTTTSSAVSVTHTQPLTGTLAPTTQLAARVTVAPRVELSVRDDIDWTAGHRAGFGLSTTLGGTNLSVGYDLPTASGDGNRARFAADTSLTLNDHLSFGLSGSASYDLGRTYSTYSIGPSLRYQDARISGTVGTDLSLSGSQFKTVLRAGVTGSVSDTLTLGADLLNEFSSTPGARYSVSAAYRDSEWNSLGYLRYQTGSLAGNEAQFQGELSSEYHTATLALRGGLAARELLSDPGSLTYQPSVSGTYYLNDRLGVGLGLRALIQPSTGTSELGYGLEASVRALPGTWLTAGYNFKGFEGLGSPYTRQGLYLRLDLMLDETELGGKK